MDTLLHRKIDIILKYIYIHSVISIHVERIENTQTHTHRSVINKEYITSELSTTYLHSLWAV